MPTAKATSDETRATSLCSCSWAFGMAIITATPTSGTNVMTARAQWWGNVFIATNSPVALSDDQHENAGQDGGRSEEQRCVLLDSTGLHLAQPGPGFIGDRG